jgi:carbonic anhydrase
MEGEKLQGRTPSMADMAHLSHEEKAATPQEAIRKLIEGNERFYMGKAEGKVVDAFQRRQHIIRQTPFAVVLGCSDSRVPIEIVMDQGPGDLFVVRVAGNVAERDALATIEFALKYLEIRLVVILGHEGCSAVQLAMGSWLARQNEPRSVRELLEGIVPALGNLDPKEEEKERIRKAVQANVRHQVAQLRKSDSLRQPIRDGKIDVVGAYYEIASGRVEFLDYNPGP